MTVIGIAIEISSEIRIDSVIRTRRELGMGSRTNLELDFFCVI